MKLADHLRVGSLRLLLGEVRHYRTPKWFGTCLCVYLSISSVKSTRLPASLLLYRCLPWRYTSYIRIWTKTRELLAATLVGKHTQRDTHTHTHTHTHSSYRHSHPSGPRFPVQHLARTAVCRGGETQSLIRRHRGTATQPLTHSTDPLW